MQERIDNCYALTMDDINKLKSIKLDGRLEVVRDIFLLQCYCGFRFEDLSLLLDSKNLREKDGIKYSVYTTQKKGITSQTPLNHPSYFPEALDIYMKYVNKPPFNDKQHNVYNKILKKIAEMAELDNEITITYTEGITKQKKKVKLYEKISSHIGRHTFITNCKRYKNIEPDKVALITGHADIRLIESIYKNLLPEDKINMVHNTGFVSEKIVESYPKVYTVAEGFTQLQSSNHGIVDTHEALRVLNYLGADTSKMESMSFDELVDVISRYQVKLHDECGISLSTIKALFNENTSLVKRKTLLKNVCDALS